MTGLFLITHNTIGQALVTASLTTFHDLPLQTICLGVHPNDDFEKLLIDGENKLNDFTANKDVILLTDIYGATPSNLAHQLAGTKYPVLCGVNLPMLFRLYNYPQLAPDDLLKKAIQGGQTGIMTQTVSKEAAV